jgi:nicotinamidase/pyrazinamidase
MSGSPISSPMKTRYSGFAEKKASPLISSYPEKKTIPPVPSPKIASPLISEKKTIPPVPSPKIASLLISEKKTSPGMTGSPLRTNYSKLADKKPTSPDSSPLRTNYSKFADKNPSSPLRTNYSKIEDKKPSPLIKSENPVESSSTASKWTDKKPSPGMTGSPESSPLKTSYSQLNPLSRRQSPEMSSPLVKHHFARTRQQTGSVMSGSPKKTSSKKTYPLFTPKRESPPGLITPQSSPRKVSSKAISPTLRSYFMESTPLRLNTLEESNPASPPARNYFLDSTPLNPIVSKIRPPTVPKNSVALIIDPQNDFFPALQSVYRKAGSVAVPGADADINRYINFLGKHPDVKHIVVSLDTHQHDDIGHPGFWIDDYGKHPKPFTVITAEEIENEKWSPLKSKSAPYALKYAKKLEQNTGHNITIWPYHAIKNLEGHEVVQELRDFLSDWEKKKDHTVEYVEKGNNPYTQFYSLFQAGVPLKSDPSTELNLELINRLKGFDKVYIGGVALSHCVNHSVRDLVDNWPHQRKDSLVLLTDTSSPMPGFERRAEDFIRFAKNEGLTVGTTEDY